MRRRQIIRGMAAGSALGVTAGLAAGNGMARVTDPVGTAELKVVRDGETVRTVENPTWEAVRQLRQGYGDDVELITSSGECVYFCCDDCDCSTCSCVCSSGSCCDPEAQVCGC